MHIKTLARPTAPRLPHVRTATPGGTADYRHAATEGNLLATELRAYGVCEPGDPRGQWEDADWECLARRAGA